MKIEDKSEMLRESLLDALTLEWQDNGNIMAEAVRDSCIQTLASVLGTSISDIEMMIEVRITHKQ